MNLDIITGLPSWYILLCVFAGILGAMLLYFREKRSEISKWMKRLLGVVRFLTITLIAFLLLSPLLKMTRYEVEKPIILIATDNSNSLVLSSDSLYYKHEYRGQINELAAQFEENHEIRLYTFGEEVNPAGTEMYDTLTFDEQQTDIAALFDMMDVRYINRNIGALIIATDGIYNNGFNPVYYAENADYPIYTIALGDTVVRSDAYLKRVMYNRIAFRGNDFPLEIIVNASKMNGRTLTLEVLEGDEVLESRQLVVDNEWFSRTLNLTFPAESAGTHHYLVRLSSEHRELTEENNQYDLFIDVLESKQKVLIIANSPHPDISALKQSIQDNINYEVEDVLITDFSGSLDEYNLIILHQLPSFSPLSSGLFNRLERTDIPLLFILGDQTNLLGFNEMKAGLSLQAFSGDRTSEAQPAFNESFTSFIVPGKLIDLLPSFPPLDAIFARYNTSASPGVLFTQRIGGIESGDPLWLLYEDESKRTGVICGTGLWKWRIRTWLGSGDHELFNQLLSKTVQYLSMKDDKRRFRVNATQRTPENLPVSLSAELHNQSYEPYNEPDVYLEVIDEEGNKYEYLFNRTAEAYTLDIGGLEVGSYSFRANTEVGDESFTDEGGFAIVPVIAEQSSLKASHDMLEELAESKGGQMIYAGEMLNLPALLDERGDIKPRMHAERRYLEFIDIIWILGAILLLMTVEWFLRKWSGSY